MATFRVHRPVLLITAAFSRHVAALEWAKARCERDWGPAALESPRFEHADTQYYEKTMGPDILKCFFAFERLIDPARLGSCKRQSCSWEDECRVEQGWSEPRPLNLDPGYLTEAKLVLASTKDRDHRLYLGDGVFAEQTLYFQHGAWRPREWTYPDYRRADYHQFFLQCRDYLRKRYAAGDVGND